MRRNYIYIYIFKHIGWAGGECQGVEMLDLARPESWNKEASLCCLLCPGFLPVAIWGLGKRVLLHGYHLGFCAHPTVPSILSSPCSPLPCPCLPAHCVGTSDFMKSLRSHLHPAALKSLPALRCGGSREKPGSHK